jgi:hypothetical protein
MANVYINEQEIKVLQDLKDYLEVNLGRAESVNDLSKTLRYRAHFDLIKEIEAKRQKKARRIK